jgi:protein-disulfide isomerase
MSSRVKAKQANRLLREQQAAEARRRRTIIVSIVAAAALLIAGLVGWAVYASQRPSAYAVPSHTGGGDDTGIVVSSGGAPVDIYLDYLCPICKRFETDAQSTLDSLAAQKKVTLTYHPIAILDDRTNPAGYSTQAGAAAGCASDGGKFLEYTKALYAQQPGEGSAGLTNDQLIQIAKSIGLTDPSFAPSFAQCVNGGKYKSWMAHNTDSAAGKNINGTPTVLVNGKPVQASADAIKAAVGG